MATHMKKLAIVLLMCIAAFAVNAETVHYVELEFTQSSFTLSLRQHIKDACNAFSITLPTTKKFYDSVKVGQELDSKFKMATFLLSGHIGNRKVTVKNKFVREEPNANAKESK